MSANFAIFCTCKYYSDHENFMTRPGDKIVSITFPVKIECRYMVGRHPFAYNSSINIYRLPD